MKTTTVAAAGIGSLVFVAAGFASVFEIRLASAQVDATSSPSVTADASSTPPIPDTSTTTSIESSTASTQASEAPSTAPDATTTSQGRGTEVVENDIAASVTPIGPPPPGGLHLVHIIGTKYTDYFTDGSTTVAYRRDPATDPNFDKPDAIRAPEGMSWVHTTGTWLYDTPSGDLELGDYALQPSGTYIQNAPPFVSSTSTPAQTMSATASDASSSVPSSDNSSSTSGSAATSTL